MVPNNLQNIDLRACRVCLHSNFSNGVILDNNSEWMRVFEYCVGLTIDHDDPSRRMCITCARVLTNYAEFKKQCHISNKVWKSLKVESKYNCNEVKIEKLKVDVQYPSTSTYNDNLCADTANITIKKEFHGADENDVEYINTEYLDNFSDENDEKTNGQKVVLESELEIEPTSNNNLKELEKLPKPRVSVKRKRKRRKGRFAKKKKVQVPVVPITTVSYCGLCEVNSTDIEYISKHIEEHKNDRELKCKLCEYEGRDFADLVSHRYSHCRKDNKVTVKCHICDKMCMHAMILQFHYRSEHLGKKGGWCTVCNKTFNKYKYWRNHEKLHKEDTKKFICDHCGRAYLFRNQMEAHWQDLSGYKPFICDVCGKRFKRNRSLKLHLSTAHVTEPIKCKHCNRTYKNKINLDLHMKAVLRDKNYICEVCSKSFPTKYSLNGHMLWHADERPYACEICEVKYKVKSQLKIHMRSHTGIFPYKCDYCDRRFATFGQKRVHASVHTGIRPHKCLYCERSFHGKKQLREHYLTRHQPSDILVSPCKEETSDKKLPPTILQ